MGLNLSEAHQPPFGFEDGHSIPSDPQYPLAFHYVQKESSNFPGEYIVQLLNAK